MRPLAGLLAVVTTVTTPAVLAACLALCMPEMRGHLMATAAVSEAPVASPEAECPDHAVAAPVAATATSTTELCIQADLRWRTGAASASCSEASILAAAVAAAGSRRRAAWSR